MSWITLDDEVRAITHLLAADVAGPVNLVAPHAVTNRELTQAVNRAVHRPTFPVPVPGFALKTALGPFAEEGVLIGQRLVPAVLERSGFTFAHLTIDTALAAVLTPA
jgi:NAD dependent epimerase/dehydratase family enzyme